MAFILIAALGALVLFLNVVAIVDINETGILQGNQKSLWLLIVWLIPLIGFFLYQLNKPKLYESSPEERGNTFRENAGDAI